MRARASSSPISMPAAPPAKPAMALASVVAAEFVGADQVIPCHYNTFPPVETDVQAFKSDVQNAGYAEVVVLDPGGVHTP